MSKQTDKGSTEKCALTNIRAVIIVQPITVGWMYTNGGVAGCVQVGCSLDVYKWGVAWMCISRGVAGCVQVGCSLDVYKWGCGWMCTSGGAVGCVQVGVWPEM